MNKHEEKNENLIEELDNEKKMNEGIAKEIYNWSSDAKNKIQLAFLSFAEKTMDAIFKEFLKIC